MTPIRPLAFPWRFPFAGVPEHSCCANLDLAKSRRPPPLFSRAPLRRNPFLWVGRETPLVSVFQYLPPIPSELPVLRPLSAILFLSVAPLRP